jgi:hypothetical protein
MLNSSRAVLLRPSVSTFEEHEQNNLGWATIYVAIGSIITAVLGAVSFLTQRATFNQLEQQYDDLERQLGQPIPFRDFLIPQNPIGPIISNLVGTLVVFFIFLGIIFLLGKLFGGTGSFGQLAYDVALFWTPISVISGVVSVLSVGPLACITLPITLALVGYNLYLTYLSVRAGMNLPSGKAIMVIATPLLLVFVACCALTFLLVAAGSAIQS